MVLIQGCVDYLGKVIGGRAGCLIICRHGDDLGGVLIDIETEGRRENRTNVKQPVRPSKGLVSYGCPFFNVRELEIV